jgi:nicotinate-nucleotide--dimethylbenzimidazole phosphoribosyltransferase
MISAAMRAAILPADPAVAAAARERIDQLTKPRGSLGRIEALAEQLSAIAGGIPAHNYERRMILIGAADHGVAAVGVSAYPPEVTAQMVAGFLGETAAINAFARAVRAEVMVANFGVRGSFAPHPRLIDVAAGPGTENLAQRAAIPRERVDDVVALGVDAFTIAYARAPFDVLALGEMGIGNTTSASAIVAAFTGEPVASVTGRGTGIDEERLGRKIAAIEAALARCRDFTWDEIASEVGGYEIVGLAGVMLAAARARIPIVLDGFIIAAAALIAIDIAPSVRDYCIAAHRSREPGHASALAAMALDPLFDFDLRLGEASGAALVLPIVEAAARMVREMRTFAEAGVATESAAPGAIAT